VSTPSAEPTVCRVCRATAGTLHAVDCALNTGGQDYVQDGEAVPESSFSGAASAVLRMIDGGLVPTAAAPSGARRVELAAIWLSEATAELNEALLEADANGVPLTELGSALKMSAEGVRQRLQRLRALPRYGPESRDRRS
jgi:hypothetical protein